MNISLNAGCHYNPNHRRPFPGPFRPCPGGLNRPLDLLPPRYRARRRHGNLEDQHVGPSWRRNNPFCPHRNKGNGYVIDLNNNGRYDRGKDGVLVFDTNRDGKYDQRDVSSTNNMMKAARGNFDFNGDGCISRFERIQGVRYKRRFARLDRNRDGKLSTQEISCGGGKVWIDKSKGGGISRNELYSPHRLPGDRGHCGGSRKLDWVDPFCGSQTSSNNHWYRGGGIRFGGGGFGGNFGGGFGSYGYAR